MKHDTPEDDDDTQEGKDLPVINLDEDPDNANWIRILERRRQQRNEGDE